MVNGGLEPIGETFLSENTAAKYFRDKVTDVMYLYMSGYRSGGLSVMLNPATGKPLTYTDYNMMSSKANHTPAREDG